MANFNEEAASTYDWKTGGVYVIEETDPVQGGPEGVSNRQGRELAVRTRNLHERLEDLKQETTDSAADLAEAIDTKTEAALRSSKEYADSVSATGSEAALRSAKDYTDTRETSILAAADVKDAATLRSSKDYTDTSIDALVDGAPETMNTIREVAEELKKHKDTATAMMQVIGEKATKDEVNAALTKKQNTTTDPGAGYDLNNLHTTGTYNVINAQNSPVAGWIYVDVIKFTAGAGWVSQFVYTLGSNNTPNRMFHRNGINTSEWTPWVELWHTGNFNPDLCLQSKGMRADISQEMIGTGFQYDTGGSGTTGPFLSAGSTQYALQIVCGYWAGNGGYQNLKFRTRNGDTGVWNPWHTVYSTGNLKPTYYAQINAAGTVVSKSEDWIQSVAWKSNGNGVYCEITPKMAVNIATVQITKAVMGGNTFRGSAPVVYDTMLDGTIAVLIPDENGINKSNPFNISIQGA